MLKRWGWFFINTLIIIFFTSTVNAQSKPNKNRLKTIIIDAGHGLPDPGAAGKYSTESQITLQLALKLSERLKEAMPDCKILLTRNDENLPDGHTDKDKANRYRAQFANENHGDLFVAIHVNSMEDRYQRRIEGYREETYTVRVGKGKKKRKVEKTRTVPIYKSYKLPCDRHGTETYIWAVNKYDQKQRSVGSRDDDDQFGEHADSSLFYTESPEAKILASLRTKKFFDQSLVMAGLVEDEFAGEGRVSYGVKQRNHLGIWVLQATNMPSVLVETGFICDQDEEDYLNSEKGQDEVTTAILRALLRYKQYLEGGNSTVASPDASGK